MLRPWFLNAWCVAAAFGTYACMYGFRKPFTVGTYDDGPLGANLKAWYVTAQVLGYMLSKFIGIKVIAEMTPARRAATLLTLIGVAEAALVGFAVVPAPYNAACLFLNGLPLGLVFGLVLGFLEGRRMTEFLIAGLCASFILADGITKSTGALLLQAGVAERWMPCLAGAIFAGPLAGFVWMLRFIPPPSASDVAARAPRDPMSRTDRTAFLLRHGASLTLIFAAFLFITVLRSVRADFAPEIWTALGFSKQPAVFTQSEIWVAAGILAVNGLMVLIRDNRTALATALAVSAGGLGVLLASVAALKAGQIQPFAFMVALGLGLYIPYVLIHTTVFERLVALTRERANVGFLMYVADAVGYLGYAAVMMGRGAFAGQADFLAFFLPLNLWLAAGAAAALLVATVIHARHGRAHPIPLAPGKASQGIGTAAPAD